MVVKVRGEVVLVMVMQVVVVMVMQVVVAYININIDDLTYKTNYCKE